MCTLRIASRPDLVRWVDGHAPVEAAWPQQRLVKDVRAVGRREHDDALARREAIHLGQDLVQRLLPLVVAAERACPTGAADCVELIDEDDGRGGLTRLFEQVAHAAGADADDHFDELAGAHAEKGHVGFPGYGAREQRLARTRRADQQHAFRYGATQARVLGWIPQKIDDLFELLLGLVDPRDVGKGDARDAFGGLVVALGAAAAQAERPA